MNILIVDDEPSYRMLVSKFLQEQGWTIFSAKDGEDGLKKLYETKMDFVISDVYMPGMDGIKFYSAVRRIPRYAEVPFLFVSAYDDEYTLQAIKNPRIEGFLRKARTLDELKAWIVYLSTPIEKRPPTPPGKAASDISADWRREETRKPRSRR